MKLTLNLADRVCVNRRKVQVCYAGALAAVIFLLVYQVVSIRDLQAHGRQVKAHLAELEAAPEMRRTEPELPPERRQKLLAEIAFANDLIDKDRFRWTALLDRLEKMTVDGIALNSLQPDFKEKSLQLNGLARGIPQLRAYLDRLIASGEFAEVFLMQQAKVPVRDGQVERQAVSFSLVLKGGF